MLDDTNVAEVETADLERFMTRCEAALSHQVAGDSSTLLGLWSSADDVAILGAIGTYATGWENVRKHLLGAARSLDWTGFTVENIVTTVEQGLAVSVNLEHMTRQTNAGTETRTLRATQVYRLESGAWRLILRHANAVTADDQKREAQLLEHL